MSERYQLYKYDSCPFCRRVLRFLEGSNVQVTLRDIHRDPGAMQELMKGGGRTMVPCLRIDRDSGTEWMYESLDIIAYLESHPG
jgi:glutathione S-transferase